MHKLEMLHRLQSVDLNAMPPMFVISYSRAGSAPLLEEARGWELPTKVHVVVRESQEDEYRAAYPELTIDPLPDEEIPGCGFARMGAMRLARRLGYETAILLDDDVISIRYMHHAEFIRGNNIGKEKSAHAAYDWQRILAVAATVADEVYADHPRVVYGGMIKQHMSFDFKNHRTKYTINGGVTPRQVMFWNLRRAEEYGVELDLDRFGITGEDLGFADQVLRRDLDAFCLSSFCYDHWPESINKERSTIRNEETYRDVLEYDYESIQMNPLKDYVRIKRNKETGDYEWADVNWQALHKLRGTKRIKEEWDAIL